MSNIIPPTNTMGLWKVKSPYTVNETLPYRLIAIREFIDITNLGQDVYKTFYQPFGLKEGELIPGTSDTFQFQKEVDNKVVILTLKSETGVVLQIPSSFIKEFPNTSIVNYRPMIVSLNIGLFREGTNYDILLQALEETCKTYAGVDSVTSAIHAGPSTSGLTQEQVDALELARQNKQSASKTNIERVVELEARNDELTKVNQEMFKVLLKNGLITT